MDAMLLHRIHFAFTIIYHYLFPQLTMGLALLIVVLKTIAIRHNDERYNQAARFWGKIFAINFLLGVVTGIPMEFQWKHWGAAFLVFVGSWISGFFIIVTNAWMQHPVAYSILPNGVYEVTSFWGLLTNPWALLQYAHNMSGAVVTGAFVMCSLGAFYVLENRFAEHGQIFLRVGVVAGVIASVAQIFPTGDVHGRYVAKYQPAAIAAMEGLFRTQKGAPIVLIGQPDEEHQTIDNPIAVNDVLSFLIYGTTRAEVKGLNEFPRDQWPEPLPLLFYSYHIMAGLGTYFAFIMVVAAFLLWRGKLFQNRWVLWALLLSFPFPYIANTAGWLTAELGRQPWVVYGLIRTSEGYSKYVGPGNSLFTLLGFMGLYTVTSILFIVLVYRIIDKGPMVGPLEQASQMIPPA